MKDGPDIARIASLIGDPARANILSALMGGVALTAAELAGEAGVTPQTASSHLAKLEEGGLVVPRRQGRHKYFALASDEVAGLLEGLAGLAAHRGHTRTRRGPRDAAMRHARVCYNHLAGDLAVQMFDSLVAEGALDLDHGITLTPKGEAVMAGLGVDLATLRAGRPALVRECLDWSERRSHLGGSLGRALFGRFLELGWVRREEGSRVVRFTGEGLRRFNAAFPRALEAA
ncbi:ArsR/SmtB family transcription factor [Acuticoccus mangrovi]|uniref:Winged helix-turn-helix transcriptional regulator n=1 Tax=Acuticoccus mangrovi TaxID=2796142 RepID=A0A934ISG2_9HYPH|nr:winged helix-turn-helix domain-containing protein [Acuticoccus mangrovi]MBJ3777210.1 winged helix-turn-helix transcriptional regulator [Acuticoccus mangrovi]